MLNTPGPWGYTYDGSSDWSIGPADDPQGDGRVAHVWDKNDERARANVSLIAAAPEMLAMLKRLEWEGAWADSPIMPDPYRACPTCHAKWAIGKHDADCELAALMAKAEGK
jgi:hypothetical protein